jgi:titin
VTNTQPDYGEGTLRSAILWADGHAGLDTIAFSIPGVGPHTIPLVLTESIDDPVLIDGYTQPLSYPASSSQPATIKIEIDGWNMPMNTRIFEIAAGGCTLRGLAITNAQGTGDGIRILTNGGNKIEGCYIGVDPSGAVDKGNGGYGIAILSSPDNTVGGTTPAERNIISGNGNDGIYINYAGSANNVIQGNYVGTDATGTASIPNDHGIHTDWAENTLIGGTTSGAANVVSGNLYNGIWIRYGATIGSLVQGNLIGTDPTGTFDVGNGANGVGIENSSNHLVGGSSAAARNIISGNDNAGVWIAWGSTSNIQVKGNHVGTDVTGTVDLGNTQSGFAIDDVVSVQIGGASANERNIISGNDWDGIGIYGGATNVVVQGNFIGTDVTGTSGLGNSDDGIDIYASSDITIGGTSTGLGNLISANGEKGVWVRVGCSDVVAQGNLVGTDASGALDRGNTQSGFVIEDSNNIQIGGSGTNEGNITSGNGWDGITVANVDSGVVIEGNYIGTNITGTSAIGNDDDGIDLYNAHGVTIGGTGSGTRNVIAANGAEGIWIRSGSSGTVIQGNYIGTDASGTGMLGNWSDGIEIDDSPSTTVGGSMAGAGNIISDNGGAGIDIDGSASAHCQIMGNYIGTDVTGMVDFGNGEDGVEMGGAANCIIGGSTLAARNIISGNGWTGMYFYVDSTDSNLVLGNLIGLGSDGLTPLGNEEVGIFFEAGDYNIIGGVSEEDFNLIAHNGGPGVGAYGGMGNWIRGNSIFSNSGLGIDLADDYPGDGVTMNDSYDIDTGPNNFQNFPVVTSAIVGNASLTVTGTLNSEPNQEFLIAFYGNENADDSAYGEGEQYLGTITVTTDASGDASFSENLTASVEAGEWITATATGADHSTSEFSLAIAAEGMNLDIGIDGGSVALTWSSMAGASEYWIYGASNEAFFQPGFAPGYEYRIATLPSTTTSWSSSAGVGDTGDNMTYLVIALDAAEVPLGQTNRAGEFDFGGFTQ